MQEEAMIRFLRRIAKAAEDLADELAGQAARSHLSNLTETLRGHRQRQIVELPGMKDESGMSARFISDATGYDQPNVYTTCDDLVRRGILERVPGKQPVHYRLTSVYRQASA